MAKGTCQKCHGQTWRGEAKLCKTCFFIAERDRHCKIVGCSKSGAYKETGLCRGHHRMWWSKQHPERQREINQKSRSRPEFKARRRRREPYNAALSRGTHLRLKYGLTQAEYESRLAAQGGGCAMCGAGPKKKHLHVDHDHTTGKLRGILCGGCNIAVGVCEDERMVRAILYIKQWS